MRNIFKILSVTFLLPIVFLSCQENGKSDEVSNEASRFKNLIKKRVFIPTKIKWDTVNFLPQSTELVLQQVFPILYFEDDSTLFIIDSENEILKAKRDEPDRITLAVENVGVFRGHYRISKGMRLITIDSGKVEDSISVIDRRIPILYYKGDKYIIANNLDKESYNRINQYVYNVPDSESSGTDPASPIDTNDIKNGTK